MFCQLAEGRTIIFMESEHHSQDIAKYLSFWEPLSQALNSSCDQLLTIELLRLLVEASDILHCG